jgi:hypothetical protein
MLSPTHDVARANHHSYYKTAFVPKARRIAPPVTAWESFKNVFTISDRELIRIAGVDGYLFLSFCSAYSYRWPLSYYRSSYPSTA